MVFQSLFKTEYNGEGIVALCSKTYICFGAVEIDAETRAEIETNVKIVSKGLSKTLNKFTKAVYLKVLTTKDCGSGVNRGFRTTGKNIVTYEQIRSVLSYLYIKRKVKDDGVSTEPLDV